MRHEHSVCWSLPLLAELNALNADIRALYEGETFEEPPIKFFVGGSLRPGVFNMGGDLSFFVDRVRARDREGLRHYAYACVDAIYNNYHGFNSPTVTMALLEGDALGGGLEAALSCQFVIAERGVNLGFPEALFHTFPGMGAYSLVSRRLDAARAEKLILSGRIYKAEEFFEMGLIDILAEKGEGPARARAFIAQNGKRHRLLGAVGRVRRRISPLTIEELRDVTDIWVNFGDEPRADQSAQDGNAGLFAGSAVRAGREPEVQPAGKRRWTGKAAGGKAAGGKAGGLKRVQLDLAAN